MCGINYGSFPVVRHAGLDLASTAALKSWSHRASLGMTPLRQGISCSPAKAGAHAAQRCAFWAPAFAGNAYLPEYSPVESAVT
jgi:hypothetical protein